MKRLIFPLAWLIMVSCLTYPANAQNAADEWNQLMRDDSVDVNTIALYPQSVRENIFIVSTHPEGLAKIEDLQKKSQQTFRNLVSTYSNDEQQKIWNLTRYNGLFEKLAAANGKKKKVEEALKEFPAEIHDDALDYGVNHKELMVSLDKMNKDFNSGFQSVISSYPKEDQSAFREMPGTPEALSLLNENMHMTVHLGDIYKSDPDFLKQQFDSLNLVVAEQKAKETEAWKKEMKDNPDAAKEMKESAGEYAKENGISESNTGNTDPKVVERYVYIPYPYWCGYPSWYAYDYWYPYPYWYHTGFYFWNGDIVWIGPPSWYFVHWHFHHHPHFYHYPHLTNVYINHYYYGPHRVLSRNTVEVRNWMRDNESVLPRDFKMNQAERVDRIRDLGKAEMDLDKFQVENPGKKVPRDEFIKEHISEYPHLKQPVVEQPAPMKPETRPAEPVIKKDKPAIDRPRTVKPEIRKEQPKPVYKEPVPVKPGKTPVPKPKTVEPKTPKAAPARVPVKPSAPREPKKEMPAPKKK